ncbi:VOC family protein [Thermomonospora cellulosilytica]|uniref:Catechol 2,3-dioxygenase-like lactoylglutathione lyase family enzyme n=1 Tax=Thermomonospora cellulosilytica TaxID=1411118 RepID=A0A7W3RB13_9ACTN|nr:VOC family protein [Thermomonospora cellulosilytica]MBA9006391.1 catechol 2,3-dioxygenase-like lactoylglutathione lyase family enzyme [Thermomonospora cellulosilytica]
MSSTNTTTTCQEAAMITGLGVATVWVLDQDRAKDFFVDKLGMEVRDDLTLGEGGMRWVTVGAKDQPDLMLTLMVPGPPTHDPETAEQIKALIAKGALGAGAFTTDDCEGDYRAMKARGVNFLQEPQKRPYGVEAIFRDDFGNWFSLTQPSAELDESVGWS